MTIRIRTEQIQDYAGIAEIHAAAFTRSAACSEAALVDMLRHRATFDPELSLVAEADGRPVGHASFSPRRLMLGGELVPAVVLSPVAVLPEYQNRGIGSGLIREGHRRAQAKGFALSVVLGHPDYYPRFGYERGMFGTCRIKIRTDDLLAGGAADLAERRVRREDLPALLAMWRHMHADADLAFEPEAALTDWISPNRNVSGSVFERNGEIAAYVRYDIHKPHEPKCFLARDADSASAVLVKLKEKCDAIGLTKPTRPRNADSAADRGPAPKPDRELAADREPALPPDPDPDAPAVRELCLPLHPVSGAVRDLLPVSVQSDIRPWDAAMLLVLDRTNLPAVRYCEEVRNGRRPIGCLNWPVEFDVFG